MAIPPQYRLLEETGRLDNFRRAAGKKGAANRTEAIAHARQLGILP